MRRFVLAVACAVSLPLTFLVGAPAAGAAVATADGVAETAAARCVLKPGGQCAGADLRGRDLTGRDLRGIDLRGARLERADLRRANLTGADLRDAELDRSDLRRASLRNADVRGADFAGAQMYLTRLGGTDLGDDDQDVVVFPNELDKVSDLLDSARETIDIVIYEIGGPTLVGQAGAPGALMRAVSRGVKVRVMVNGNWEQCTYDDTAAAFTNQYSCAAVYSRKVYPNNGTGKASPTYAVQESLMAAYADPLPGVTPVLPQVQFANNNFNVTHEKTIIVDGSYASGPNAGQPRTPQDMLDSSEALVMTGNLLSNFWGSSYNFAADDTTWQTQPNSTCGSGGCPIENPARDFGVPVDNPVLISEIVRVFASDFMCGAASPGGPASRTNTNGLLTTNLPLTWSNGSFQAPVGTTPTEYPSAVVGYQFPTSYGQTVLAQTEQGNVRGRMLDLINGARDSLLVYNEELSDPQVIAALGAAAQRLGAGKVKLIMTWNAGSKTQKSWPSIWKAWNTLDDSGVSIMLSEYAGPYATNDAELYVHAKVIVADEMYAYVGSTNFTAPSMDWNRELGVRLTNREAAGGIDRGWIQSVRGIRDLVTRFTQDFADTSNMTSWDVIEPQLPPNSGSSSTSDEVTVQANTINYTGPLLCGPLPTSDTPVPAP